MDQVETKNVAKTLSWIGNALFWLAGVGLFKGLAAIIFNQVKNNELPKVMRNKE